MLNLGTGLLSLLEKKHFSLIHTVTSQLRDGKDRVMLLYGIPSLNIAKCLKVHFSRTSDIADYSLKKTEPGPSTSKGFALVLQSFQKRSYVPHNPFRDPFMWDEPKKGCKPKHKGCRKIGKILGDKRHCCPCSEGRRFPQTLGRGFECKKCLVKKRTTPACNRHCRGHVLKCPKKRMTFCEYTDHKCKVPKKQNVPIFTYAALKEDRRRAAEEAEYGVEDPHGEALKK